MGSTERWVNQATCSAYLALLCALLVTQSLENDAHEVRSLRLDLKETECNENEATL